VAILARGAEPMETRRGLPGDPDDTHSRYIEAAIGGIVRPGKSPISNRPRLARNTIIESTFEVGRRFRCTMRIDCGQLDPGAVIRPDPGEWHPRMPERLDDEELADWRAGRNAVYQLAALTVGARLAVADA